MVESENNSKFPTFWVMVIIFLTIILLILWWFFRDKGFKKVFIWFLVIVFIIFILGGIIFLVLYLLRKQRVDMIHVMKQRIIKACELCPPKSAQKLYFMGSETLEYRYIGEVVGICRAKSEPVVKIDRIENKKDGTYKEVATQIKPSMDVTFIAFKKKVPFPLSLFDKTNVFIGLEWIENDIKHSDFSHLSGDAIYLRGMTFAPELYSLFFLSHHFKETFMIDEVAKELIYRYMLQDNLSDIKNISDDLLAISPEHRKIMEKTRINTIAGGYSGQQPQNTIEP